MEQMTWSVVRERTLPVPASELWRLVTDPRELGAWLGDAVALPGELGAVGSLRTDDGLRSLRIEHRDEGRSFGFVWWPDGDAGAASTVTFTIEADDTDPDRSRLRVEERPVATAGARACNLLAAEAAWDERLLALELRTLAGSRSLALV